MRERKNFCLSFSWMRLNHQFYLFFYLFHFCVHKHYVHVEHTFGFFLLLSTLLLLPNLSSYIHWYYERYVRLTVLKRACFSCSSSKNIIIILNVTWFLKKKKIFLLQEKDICIQYFMLGNWMCNIFVLPEGTDWINWKMVLNSFFPYDDVMLWMLVQIKS